VTTTTTTTIRGVSLITGQGAPGHEVFEIVLSAGGIDFRRAERPGARLTWDRVSDWEIKQRKGEVVLTLQGVGAATPLLIPGWSASDLDALLRQLTEQPAAAAAAPAPAPDQAKQKKAPATATNTNTNTNTNTKPTNDRTSGAKTETGRPGVVDLLGPAPAATATATTAGQVEAKSATSPPSAQTQAAPVRRRSRRLAPWKAVVTIALLGVVAAAVLIVLLQSAGIISWSILGPTS
jgi:ribosomal protein L12E/L44/L45/RPP1/RPP2